MPQIRQKKAQPVMDFELPPGYSLSCGMSEDRAPDPTVWDRNSEQTELQSQGIPGLGGLGAGHPMGHSNSSVWLREELSPHPSGKLLLCRKGQPAHPSLNWD